MAVRGNMSGPAAVFSAVAVFGSASEAPGGSIGALRGIHMGGPTTQDGSGTFGRHLQVGVKRNDADGEESAPCLQLTIPGMWRFRWVVKPGTRTIKVSAKQASNSGTRPSVTVKANPDIGVNSDQVAYADSSTDWVVIGPVTFTPTAKGMVWVELANNSYDDFHSPALFDHIVIT